MSAKISDRTIDRIREAVDIVEIIGAVMPLRRSGKDFKGLCPFHEEKTPSFYVVPGKQIFHCFGCGEGGSVYTFLQKRERLSFPEAVRALGERAGIPVESSDDGHGREDTRLYDVCRWASERYAAWLQAPSGVRTREYLLSRGLTRQTIETFLLGATPPERDGLVREAASAGWTEKDLQEAGLCRPARTPSDRAIDAFYSRAIFPVRDAKGRVCGFAGRVLPGAPDDAPKYVNTAETRLFSKRRLLYGLWEAQEAIRKRGESILVEGYTDVLHMHQAGMTCAVATMGTALTSENARLLKRCSDKVLLLFDGDEAGVQAARRAATPVLSVGLSVRVCIIPGGEDPADFLGAHGAGEFERVLAGSTDLIRFLISRAQAAGEMGGPDGKAKVAEEVVGWIRGIADPVRRDLWLQDAAGALGISREALVERSGQVTARRLPSAPTRKSIVPLTLAAQDLLRLVATDPTRAKFVRESLVGVREVLDGEALTAASLLERFCSWAEGNPDEALGGAGSAKGNSFGGRLEGDEMRAWAQIGAEDGKRPTPASDEMRNALQEGSLRVLNRAVTGRRLGVRRERIKQEELRGDLQAVEDSLREHQADVQGVRLRIAGARGGEAR